MDRGNKSIDYDDLLVTKVLKINVLGFNENIFPGSLPHREQGNIIMGIENAWKWIRSEHMDGHILTLRACKDINYKLWSYLALKIIIILEL